MLKNLKVGVKITMGSCHFSGAFTHPFSKAFTQVQQNTPTILLYQNHIKFNPLLHPFVLFFKNI